MSEFEPEFEKDVFAELRRLETNPQTPDDFALLIQCAANERGEQTLHNALARLDRFPLCDRERAFELAGRMLDSQGVAWLQHTIGRFPERAPLVRRAIASKAATEVLNSEADG